jgi:hypothetical protein
MGGDIAYGLAATVWTNDMARIIRLSEWLKAEIIWTNCPHHLQWNASHQSHAVSGLGEELGLDRHQIQDQSHRCFRQIAGLSIDLKSDASERGHPCGPGQR